MCVALNNAGTRLRLLPIGQIQLERRDNAPMSNLPIILDNVHTKLNYITGTDFMVFCFGSQTVVVDERAVAALGVLSPTNQSHAKTRTHAYL